MDKFTHKFDMLRALEVYFPELYSQMAEQNHAPEGEHSFYHLEGSVLTHTLMVLSHAAPNPQSSAAALLHDIGKVKAATYLPADPKKDKDARIIFNGHEGLSFFMALPILRKLNLSDHEITASLIAIAIHGHFWFDSRNDIFNKIKGFNLTTIFTILDLLYADANGRISLYSGLSDSKNLSKHFLNYSSKLYDSEAPQDSPVLTIMIGLPGSGKSTYVKENLPNIPVVSRDDLVMEHGVGSDYSEKWNDVNDNKELNSKVNALVSSSISNLAKSKKSFVIDMTNMSKKSRKHAISQARQHGYFIEAKIMPTDIETTIERNAGRAAEGKNISRDIVERMAKAFHMPTFDEVDSIEVVL